MALVILRRFVDSRTSTEPGALDWLEAALARRHANDQAERAAEWMRLQRGRSL